MTDDTVPTASRLALAAFAVLLLVGTGAAATTLVTHERPGGYTEFYVLGPEGNAGGYPTELFVGEQGTVIVGVSNHQGQRTTHTVVLSLDGETVATRRVTLAPGETWREPLTFTPDAVGTKRVRIALYDGRETAGTPDEVLYFSTRVTAA